MNIFLFDPIKIQPGREMQGVSQMGQVFKTDGCKNGKKKSPTMVKLMRMASIAFQSWRVQNCKYFYLIQAI
jgi:hypothetical protein